MKKQKKKKKVRSRNASFRQSSPRRARTLPPEELAGYVRLAEKEVLQLLKETPLDAATTQFLLALHTQALAMNDATFSRESAAAIANSVLALWQEGYYTPSPEYPYTLEETLQALQEGPKAQADYAGWFQPFTPEKEEAPRGFREIAGGIVKHPETNLWQIWLIIDGPCEFVGAFRDVAAAQRILEAMISLTRKERILDEGGALFDKFSQEGDCEAEQIPYDMMVYLVENIKQYTILL